MKKGRCRTVLRVFRRINKKNFQAITKTRKNCEQLGKSVAKRLYCGGPAIIPGSLGMSPAPGPSMAAAWCECKTGKYKNAMNILQKPAIFGWDTTALPAYVYILGMLKDRKTAIALLKATCIKNDESCNNILKILIEQGNQ